MRMIALVFSLVVLASPSSAAQKTSLEKKCQRLMGSEEREGRRRAKPRGPVPGAAFQRLHDGPAALILGTRSRSLA